ncbi:hypothetical protein HpRN61_15320 [Helicobacter pylori]
MGKRLVMFLLSESFGMFCLTYPLILIYGGVLGGVPLARIGDFSHRRSLWLHKVSLPYYFYFSMDG